MEYISDIFNTGFEIFLLVSPIAVYLPQYLMMRRTKTVGSFSPLVCYILIVASLLRVIFWFGNKFNIFVFFQAVVMLIVQNFVLKKFFEVESLVELNPKLSDTTPNMVATTKMNYVLTKIAVGYMCYFVLFMLFKSPWFVELTGFLSATVEACLPLPQFWSNMRRKSVEGLR